MSNEKPSLQDFHKRLAIEIFNQIWSLLNKKDKSEQDISLIIDAAHASLYHWRQCGTPLNIQRGQWMIAHVYTMFDRPEPAQYHAKVCLELTNKQDLKDFDLAFAYEVFARSSACAGKKADFEKYHKLAKEAGEAIKDKEDREIFLADFKSGPWYADRL